MFNNAIGDREFFGRKDVLSLLDKRVYALKEGYRQNIAITGQRLAGKTRLLHHFLDTVKDPTILPIYVEVINEPFFAFAERFIGTLLYTFLKAKGEDVREDLAYLLENVQKYMPKTAKTISEIRTQLNKKDFNKAYIEILNLTSIVKNETQIRCVVIFDEFQNLGLFGLKEPFSHFGKVIMIQKDTMYIISSSDKSAIQRILAEELSLLFGNFEIIELKGFDFNASKEFLHKKLANFELSEGLKSFIIIFTDGNPFYADLLCAKLRDLTLSSAMTTVNPKIMAEAIENLYFNSKGTVNQYFSNLINNLCLNTATMDILIAIAKGFHTAREIRGALTLSYAEISLRLKRLIELNILFKNGTFYFFIDSGFQFWIKEVYGRKRSSLISSATMRSDQFKHDTHAYLSKFLFNLRKDCSRRIEELFAKFKNEIIEIDRKRHRLPAFRKIDTIKLNKASALILAHKDRDLWACFVKEGRVNEDDIFLFIGEIKRLKSKVINKILIPLDGADINAILLAKENRMWTWSLKNLNFAMDIYNQEKILRYRQD